MSDPDDFDFTKPQPAPGAAPAPAAPAAPPPPAAAPFKAATSRFYDSGVAASVFKESGKEEKFGPNDVLFTEDDAAQKAGLLRSGSRMYYIAEGEVALTRAGKPLDIVARGDVFGEMSVISGRPRSATATSKAASHVYSLDAGELEKALGRHPEFAMMLASVMYDRLRLIAARLASRALKPGVAAREASVFDPALMERLQKALPQGALLRYPQGTIIMKEGQVGVYMYVVKSGKVAIAIGSNIVEVVGPGGAFGEMAVIDQSPRTARAGSTEDSELLAIDRSTLLGAVKKEPAFAMAMLRGIADRLRHMNSLLV
jgi:CRP-like cAMP-binding protein